MPIEYCLGNVTPATRRRLRTRPDAREATCLEHCGRCASGPFLVVDGAVVDGDSVNTGGHEAVGGHEAILRATEQR